MLRGQSSATAAATAAANAADILSEEGAPPRRQQAPGRYVGANMPRVVVLSHWAAPEQEKLVADLRAQNARSARLFTVRWRRPGQHSMANSNAAFSVARGAVAP